MFNWGILPLAPAELECPPKSAAMVQYFMRTLEGSAGPRVAIRDLGRTVCRGGLQVSVGDAVRCL